MNFLEALKVAVQVIREWRDEIDEIYLYEKNNQVRIYLKDCDGNLRFTLDDILSEQVFLGGVVDDKSCRKQLSLDNIFSASWEVRAQKRQCLIYTNYPKKDVKK